MQMVDFILDTLKKKLRIGCEPRIEQRMIDPSSGLSYKPLFLKIAELLGTKLEISRHNDKNYYLVRGNNRKSLNLILNYFYFYNLYSSKYLDYKN
jgi:LAGLIDADG endonuclease